MTAANVIYVVTCTYSHYDEYNMSMVCWRHTAAEAKVVVEQLERELAEYGAWCKEWQKAHPDPRKYTYEDVREACARGAQMLNPPPQDLTSWNDISYDYDALAEDPKWKPQP